MKTILLNAALGFSLVTSIASSAAVLKQFPQENRVYRPKVDQGFDQYRTSSLKKSNKIVLTYDDGPHVTRTPKLLDMLKKYNVKATFFVLTENITSKTMPIIHRIMKEGHILASHDHDHDNNNGETEEQFRNELSESIKVLEKIKKQTGVNQLENYYRFPYGAYGKNKFYHHFNVMKDVSNEIYNENCINFAFWDIDSADWVAKLTPKKIAANIIAHIHGGTAYRHVTKKTFFGKKKTKIKKYQIKHPIGGGVVLLHDIHERSIEATEILLKYAKKKGVEIVPLNEVKEFKYNNKSCQY